MPQGEGTIIDDDGTKVPQIAVALTSPSAAIKSGQSTAVNFGSSGVCDAGASRVTNMGAANLPLGKLSLPAAYQPAHGLLATLAAGKSDMFTITMMIEKAAKYSGLARINANVD